METRKVAGLVPHPKNAEIYRDAADDRFIETVRDRGIVVPLLITWDNRVIAGHRRLDAAGKAGLEEVPVTVFASRDELDILEALVLSNDQRERTNEQMGREAKALLDVETKRAEQRMAEAGKKSAPGRPAEKGQEPVPDLSLGQARDKVGEKLNVSGKTAERAARVVEVIDELEEAGEEEEAEELRSDLNGSVGAAYAKAKESGRIPSTPRPVPAPPKHPHSDALCDWMERVVGQSMYIDTQLGGLAALLAEPDKWDWRRVHNYLLPVLEAHVITATRYLEEIRAHEAYQKQDREHAGSD